MVNNNDQYIKEAKDILKIIISTGFEAYIVSDTVRNLILENEIKYIEIFTNMPKDKAMATFEKYQIENINDDTILIHYTEYLFYIRFTKEYKLPPKAKIKSVRKHYSSSLMEFLTEKFYTINTFALGANNVIYDCYDGETDLRKKKIRAVCDNPQVVYQIEPTRMLDAILLISELGFKLDGTVQNAISKKAKCLRDVNPVVLCNYLLKIINGKFARKAIKEMHNTGLYKYAGLFKFELKRLYRSFRKENPDLFIAISLIYGKEYNQDLGKLSSNDYELEMLVNLAITNPKAKYDTLTLYSNGLDRCLKANYINHILHRSFKKTMSIKKKYQLLPIKKTCDLAFKGEDILKIGLELDANAMSDILDEICSKVLFGEIQNNYDVIKSYVLGRITEMKNPQPKEESIPSVSEEVNNDVINEEVVEEKIANVNNVYREREVVLNSETGDTNIAMILKQQEEMTRRLNELEKENLKKDLELEIEKRIKQSGMLDEKSGISRETTYKTLYKAYYDILINSEKYEVLKKDDNDGNC